MRQASLGFSSLLLLHIACPPVQDGGRQDVVEDFVAGSLSFVLGRGDRTKDPNVCAGQSAQHRRELGLRKLGVIGKIHRGMGNLRARRGYEVMEYPRGGVLLRCR